VPTPSTSQALLSRRMPTPIACNAAAVESTSSASERPSIRLLPFAIADSISARCEIDLSPGNEAVPRSGPPGSNLIGWGEALIMCFQLKASLGF
jgi:hypothetical protein